MSLLAKLPSNNRLERIWKLAQVDFQSRYYNDRLGLLWALIRPITEVVLYFIAFKFLLNTHLEDFGLFLFGGIITWMAFGEGSSRSINLLKSKAYLIENVQFSHIDLYYSHTISVLFGFMFNLIAFALACLLSGHQWTLDVLYVPILVVTIFCMIMAISKILSTIQPFFKDVTHLWDMILLGGFWLSGIFFEPKIIFEKIPWFAYSNPFVGIIVNIRGIFISSYEIDHFWLFYNLVFSIVLWSISTVLFRKYSHYAFERI